MVEGTHEKENKETECQALYEIFYNGVHTKGNIAFIQYTETADIFCEEQTDIPAGVPRIHLRYISAARSRFPL